MNNGQIGKCSCIYITYDLKLKKYLSSNGIDNLLYGLNPKSKHIFWVYERTTNLNELLDKWFCKK